MADDAGTGFLMPEGHDFTPPLAIATDLDGDALVVFDAAGRVIFIRDGIKVTRVTPPEPDRFEDPLTDAKAERIMRAIQDHLNQIGGYGNKTSGRTATTE